ncbi:tubulin-folding cofactor C [Solanum dulcamara]|uniref:tubulin-folding cofactor C n=1 Tax=Solanum dulcamara TaxID=45834 RepID=UPI002484F4A9|nr:tubulin-folding cofactor C [Solanum dulcamara]XP_055811117.1 tubulin-folding cofactor C [Solanum dulcamara]
MNWGGKKVKKVFSGAAAISLIIFIFGQVELRTKHCATSSSMEESDNPPNTAAAAAAASDSPLQRKRAAMIERLSNSHQSRLARKPDSESNSTFISTSSFLSRFSESKNSIESTLSRILHTPDPHSNPTLKSELENVSISIADLEKLVAENSFSLPSYEVRTCLKTITDLKQFVEQVTREVIPRKKFSFKNKSTKKITTQNISEVPNVESKNSVLRVLDSPGFRGRENEVIVKEFDRGNDEEIREFVLSDLKDCDVRLIGSVRALFVHKLIDCKVYVGPVFGSVLIEEVTNCVFVMASHQIRIHKAKRCDFYLRVRSRPIIEDSDGVRFSPYCLKYDGIERDLEEANLGEETGNWLNVDDFKWLRAVQSPNWSILPENERLGTVDISNQEPKI